MNNFNRIKRGILLFLKKFWKIIVPSLILIFLFYFFILRDLPSPTSLGSSASSQASEILDRNGKLLYTIYTDKNQIYVPLSSLSPYVYEASIAVEDKDFYNHGAIDFKSTLRALLSIILHRQIQGGSTITQQLVKNALLSDRQTITRKIREALLAIATSILYSKNKILELYINEIPYGGTSYGIEAASELYFGVHAKDLDIAQAALLAGLPQAPSTYSPFGAHPEFARSRQLTVLKDMFQQSYITKVQYQKAVNEKLKYHNFGQGIVAPHFSLYVKDLLIQQYGEKMVDEGGLKVTTSLDLNIQNMAQKTVENVVSGLSAYHVTNGATLVTDPGTGEILAMVGSENYFDTKNDGNVNVTLQLRQPGSSIKPINYAVGLMKGYTAATPFVDKKLCFPNGNGTQYCPQNYDFKFHGLQQMRYALGNSLNIPAVEMLKANTIPAMVATATAMGISTYSGDISKFGLSLTLGAGDVTMLDMATAYGVFANEGYRINLHPILKVVDRNGQVLQQYNPPPSPIFGQKVLPSSVAFIISSILSDNGARLIDFGPSSALVIPGKTVSVKTGTTNDFRDNWTIGYTPSYTVIAWVGNDNNSPMSSIASGIIGAAPIWHDVMSNLLENKPDQPLNRPSDIIQKQICATTGNLPPPGSPKAWCPTRFEYFIKGTDPKNFDVMQSVPIDKTTNDLATVGQTTNVENRDEIVATDPIGNKYCLTCPHPDLNPTPTP